MSVIGDDRSHRVIEGKFQFPIITLNFPRPVPIIEGRVRFFVKEINCIIDAPVRQIKTRKGTYYADKFKKPIKSHTKIICYLLEEYEKHGQYSFKPEKLQKYLNKWLRKKKQKTLTVGGVVGRCSELARLKILIPAAYSYFKLDYKKAISFINTVT